MVVVSYSGREINAKIVYYGPGLSGKTTNLEKIYDSVPETHRGRMVSMKTQTDRTLFFDLLPLDPVHRQVEEDVDDPVQPQPLERPGQGWSDALQHLHFGEQGIEDVGAHVYLRS